MATWITEVTITLPGEHSSGRASATGRFVSTTPEKLELPEGSRPGPYAASYEGPIFHGGSPALTVRGEVALILGKRVELRDEFGAVWTITVERQAP